MQKILDFPFKVTRTGSVILAALVTFASLVTLVAASEAVILAANILVWVLFSIVLIIIAIALFFGYHWLQRNHLQSILETRRQTAEVEKLERDASLMAVTNESQTFFAYLDGDGVFSVHAAHLQHRLSEKLLGSGAPDNDQTQLLKWALFTGRKQKIVNELIDGMGQGPVVLNFETVARKALSGRGAGRFIVFGGMDSGKTTLAKHAVNYAIHEIAENQRGQIFIIDPHAPKTVWGENLTVIGGGMDYTSIRLFLDRVKADIKARYAAGCGDDSKPLPHPYKSCFVVCEEWAGVIAELKSKKQWTDEDNRTFYMDSRKAGWGFLLVCHEYTVGALGLQGMGNLLSGVEYFVTLEKDAVTDRYSATLGQSFKDKNPYDLITPGAYNGRMYYSEVQAASEKSKTDKYLVLGPVSVPEPLAIDNLEFVVGPEPESNRPTPDEKKAIAAFASVTDSSKFSWRKATQLAFGPGKFGEGPNKKLRDILDKFDVSYSEYL